MEKSSRNQINGPQTASKSAWYREAQRLAVSTLEKVLHPSCGSGYTTDLSIHARLPWGHSAACPQSLLSPMCLCDLRGSQARPVRWLCSQCPQSPRTSLDNPEPSIQQVFPSLVTVVMSWCCSAWQDGPGPFERSSEVNLFLSRLPLRQVSHVGGIGD